MLQRFRRGEPPLPCFSAEPSWGKLKKVGHVTLRLHTRYRVLTGEMGLQEARAIFVLPELRDSQHFPITSC